MVTLDVRLGYRDDMAGEWTELAHSFEQRKLNCNLTISKVPDIRHRSRLRSLRSL